MFNFFKEYNTQSHSFPFEILTTESVNIHLENTFMTYLRESSTSMFTRVAERLVNVNTLRTFFRSRAVSVSLQIWGWKWDFPQKQTKGTHLMSVSKLIVIYQLVHYIVNNHKQKLKTSTHKPMFKSLLTPLFRGIHYWRAYKMFLHTYLNLCIFRTKASTSSRWHS